MQKSKIEKKTPEQLILLKKKLILLAFTREVIKNSGGELFQLKKLIEEEKTKGSNLTETLKRKEDLQREAIIKKEKEPLVFPRKPEEIEEDIEKEKEKRNNISDLKEITLKNPFRIKPPRREVESEISSMRRRPGMQILRIPEPKLPPEFQYLNPSPTKQEIDLDKLNPLIQDPMVKTIECPGSDQQIIVTGGMGRKPTNIILDEEEIGSIIEKFSQESKIPIHSGVYKVVVGRLILSAINSDVVGSKFIIKKMMYNPGFQPPRR